jgi:hexokinase
MMHDVLTITKSVVSELQSAKQKQSSSYRYIPHTFSPHPIVKDNEQFQVLIIGGSVYKSSHVIKKSDGIKVLDQKQGQQPVFDTDETFLNFVLEMIDPSVRVVGINFAYALEPVFEYDRLDGLMVGGNMKDNAFAGLENKPLGSTIEAYIKEKRGQEVIVSAANDTICLLLSGLTQYDYDQVAAGIVGTGMNFALFEDQTKMINLESAHFNKFELTLEGIAVDNHSANKGNALTEKEVAGAYLYKIFNEGLLLRNINHAPIQTTEQIDEIAENDQTEAGKFANEILDRSAGLVAAQVAGITQFLNRDTAFVMEGSLFWKGYKYRERVERLVREIIPQFNVSYIHIPDSGIFGGAKLVA